MFLLPKNHDRFLVPLFCPPHDIPCSYLSTRFSQWLDLVMLRIEGVKINNIISTLSQFSIKDFKVHLSRRIHHYSSASESSSPDAANTPLGAKRLSAAVQETEDTTVCLGDLFISILKKRGTKKKNIWRYRSINLFIDIFRWSFNANFLTVSALLFGPPFCSIVTTIFIFRNNSGSRSINGVGIGETSKHQPVNSSTNNTWVFEKGSANTSAISTETWLCLSLLLEKENNAINHGRKIRSRRWILSAPPSTPPFRLGKQHARRTDRRPLMRKLINKAINRAADEAGGPGAFKCTCRLVGCAQMGLERCTYVLTPQ